MANKEVINKWVEALRSGDYTQVEGKLAKEREDGTKGFCCLGVLCEVAVKEGVIEAPAKATDGFGDETNWFQYDGEADELPTSVMDWAGLSDHNPEVTYPLTAEEIEDNYGVYEYDEEKDTDKIVVPEGSPDTSEDTLADLNDTHGRSFSDIADIIEAEYLK